MSDKFSEQKDALLSIKHEISLLHQQVDYLLRNEKELGLLDLDVMMNRTHTIYDQMCSIDLGNAPEEMEFNEEEILNALCNHEEDTSEPTQEEEPLEEEESSVIEEEEMAVEEEAPIEEEVSVEEEIAEENEDAYFEEEVEEEEVKEEVKPEEPHAADDLGFILNFEPATEEPSSVFTTGDEIEMTIPTPTADENDYELDSPETLGDKLQQEEDHSLAAKLQHESLNDLRAAIGINDKFLFVNELFGGSMEKYNKSIDNLNDLKTLNGALIYMNELRIELQWNSNNEAYKKLLELVHRKFE